MVRIPKRLDWGEGSIRERSGRFQVRWRESGKRRSLSGFHSRAEALDELELIRARIKLGLTGVEPAPPPKPPSTTFPDLVEDWVEYRVKHGNRMAMEERSRWALHLAGPLSTQTLESVTTKWVRELAARLVSPDVGDLRPDGRPKEPISGPTAHRVISLLSSFYSWAVDEGLVAENPARIALRHRDIKHLLKSTHDPKSEPFLRSWDDVTRVYKALSRPYSIGYLLSARAGLRPGEVLALRWSDVDLDAKTIRIARQVRAGKEGPTKSGKPRTIPIVPFLAKELTVWKRRSAPAADGLVCPPPRRMRRNGEAGTAWGAYLGPKRFLEALQAACRKAKLAPGTFYQYGRHTFGSLSGLGGISTWRLQEIMGHADIKTTLHYVSLKGQELTKAELAALGA
jgi:integrase